MYVNMLPYYDKYLTKSSQEKIQVIQPFFSINVENKCYDVLYRMYNCFIQNIFLEPASPINLQQIKNVFIHFDETMNNVQHSKLAQDIQLMDLTYSIKLKLPNNNNIHLYFLLSSYDKNEGYISVILHALNTFCHYFNYNYDKLVIYICLDKNMRNITKYPQKEDNYEQIFQYLHKTSQAFNVGGITKKYNKTIILTRSEEIIKLMYHELIHYVGLDEPFSEIMLNKPNTNYSEAYTEFVSILLNCAYHSIHLHGVTGHDLRQIYKKLLIGEINYSLFLTSNIIKFFGFNPNNYEQFFKIYRYKKFAPIFVWEYIIYRTRLLLDINLILSLTKNFKVITLNDRDIIIKIMCDDKYLITHLLPFMQQWHNNNNISYTLVELDWNKI